MTFTLIGMPGCGKSCMGRNLAARMKMKNVDGDRLIEREMKMKLHEIIAQYGPEGFKQIEERILLSIEGDGLIISPGGSAVYYDDVMRHFSSLGPIVYLHVGLEQLLARLGDFSKRGIILAPGQSIEDLYRERSALYRKYADVIIDCDGTDYLRYQRRIISALRYCAADHP